MWHEVVKVDAKGRRIRAVYCCPSRAVARRVVREVRMVRKGSYKISPCL